MGARILTADHKGRILADLDANIKKMVWRLNGVGQATLDISANDAKATEDNLTIGNRVVIYPDNGLPPLGGCLHFPIGWNNGVISLVVYSGEYLLYTRYNEKSRVFEGVSPGAMFQTLIEETNALSDTGISIGNIFGGGEGHTLTYRVSRLLGIAERTLVGTLSNFDFDILPVVSGGNISFEANFYQSKGQVKRGVELLHNTNCTVSLLKQGDMANHVQIFGGGTDDSDKPYAVVRDYDLEAKHGLHMTARTVPGLLTQTSAEKYGQDLLDKLKHPQNIFKVNHVTDHNPALYSQYHIGDRVRLKAANVDYNGTDTLVKILRREFDGQAKTCTLVVDEVT